MLRRPFTATPSAPEPMRKIIGLSDTATERPESSSSVNSPRSFWITPQKSRAGCVAPIPGMSGSGGNYVLLMPNGVTAVRFAGGNDDDEESGTFDSSHMRKVADDIRPLCAP